MERRARHETVCRNHFLSVSAGLCGNDQPVAAFADLVAGSQMSAAFCSIRPERAAFGQKGFNGFLTLFSFSF